MTTQIHRISDKQPVFPCWLWHEGIWRWVRHVAFPHHDLLHNAYTHWHPDQPEAPAATPPTEQATEGGVTTERDVRNHVAAPAQEEPTETVMRNALCRVYEIINGSDDFDADEVNAIIKAATGNFPISREWSMGAAYKEEIVTLRRQLAQMEAERDQARQDLEERCAENDRERAAHLQAYQEACKERDGARRDRSTMETRHGELVAELRKDRLEDMLPSEIALRLGQIHEGYPPSEQHTKCALLITQLRQELERYEEARPMTEHEQDMIAGSLKKLDAAQQEIKQ